MKLILLFILAAMPPAAAALIYSALELRFNLPPITWLEWNLIGILGYVALGAFGGIFHLTAGKNFKEITCVFPKII